MPKRIVLDKEYIARVKKDNAPLMAAVATMEQKKIPCKFCKLRTIDKYEDLQGHFSAFCNRCGQVAVYNAADYRHYSYLPYYLLVYNKETIEAMGSGTTFKEVSGKAMRTVKVRIPSDMQSQIKIASLLDSIDSKIEANAKLNDNLAA